MDNQESFIDMLFKLEGILSISSHGRSHGLRKIRGFLQIAISNSNEQLRCLVDKCYKVYAQEEPRSRNDNEYSDAIMIKFSCLNPVLT